MTAPPQEPTAPGKSHGRYGGRAKGVPNKRTQYEKTVGRVLKKLKCDPILALARIVMNLDPATGEEYEQEVLVGKGDNAHIQTISGLDPALRLGAARELASYVAPKRKAIEHLGSSEKPVTFQIIPQGEVESQDLAAAQGAAEEVIDDDEDISLGASDGMVGVEDDEDDEEIGGDYHQ